VFWLPLLVHHPVAQILSPQRVVSGRAFSCFRGLPLNRSPILFLFDPDVGLPGRIAVLSSLNGAVFLLLYLLAPFHLIFFLPLWCPSLFFPPIASFGDLAFFFFDILGLKEFFLPFF